MQTDTDIDSEHWFKARWRPAMGWLYMTVCIFDFIIFPALWSAYLGYVEQPISQWDPLTLKSAGFFHLTMCAVLGIYAWKRSEEKIAGVEID